MKFAKTQALGNDFLLVEAREVVESTARPDLARAMCHRLHGIGADGLIFFQEIGDTSRFSMKLFNADGSPAEISGNGLRCLGAYLMWSGRSQQEPLRVDTDAGMKELTTQSRRGNHFVLVSDLGRPLLASGDVPMEIEPPADPAIGVPLTVDGRTFEVTALNMGNPQCITFVEHLDMDELRRFGPLLERHPAFPRKTNVELVEVVSRTELKIGIWERGAGETTASGTGSAASVVAARLSGKVDEEVLVRSPGGALKVDWRGGENITVIGESVVVAEGTYLDSDS
jgi:diaminopimelate epimerase